MKMTALITAIILGLTHAAAACELEAASENGKAATPRRPLSALSTLTTFTIFALSRQLVEDGAIDDPGMVTTFRLFRAANRFRSVSTGWISSPSTTARFASANSSFEIVVKRPHIPRVTLVSRFVDLLDRGVSRGELSKSCLQETDARRAGASVRGPRWYEARAGLGEAKSPLHVGGAEWARW